MLTFGARRPACRQQHRRIDWPAEFTSWVLAKLEAADSSPGVLDVIGGPSTTCIAAVAGNAAAGGLMLALAADEVWCRDGVVLNPHYQLMGLHGSEYWTYTLPRRVGADEAPHGQRAGIRQRVHGASNPHAKLDGRRARRLHAAGRWAFRPTVCSSEVSLGFRRALAVWMESSGG